MNYIAGIIWFLFVLFVVFPDEIGEKAAKIVKSYNAELSKPLIKEPKP